MGFALQSFSADFELAVILTKIARCNACTGTWSHVQVHVQVHGAMYRYMYRYMEPCTGTCGHVQVHVHVAMYSYMELVTNNNSGNVYYNAECTIMFSKNPAIHAAYM